MLLKKIIKVTTRLLLGFAAFIALYFLFAFLLSVIGIKKEPVNSNDVTIYITTNGDHTDIIVPVKNLIIDWSKQIRYEHTIAHDTVALYLAFGWGDKDFYLNTPTWAQLKFSTAFNAVFGLGSSAIHTTFYKNVYEDANCKKIMLSKEQYVRLVAYISNSFKRATNGSIINIKTNAHYNNADAFYEAKRKYNLFYTCNTWANNALKACGQKACIWTPFDKGIFYHYR